MTTLANHFQLLYFYVLFDWLRCKYISYTCTIQLPMYLRNSRSIWIRSFDYYNKEIYLFVFHVPRKIFNSQVIFHIWSVQIDWFREIATYTYLPYIDCYVYSCTPLLLAAIFIPPMDIWIDDYWTFVQTNNTENQ